MKTQLRAKFRDADLDCLSTSIVEDLLQGTTDWKAIDDIVKLTLKALTDVVKMQSQSIKELKSTMPTRASKSQLTTGLSLKANTSDVARTIAQVSNVLETRVSMGEFHAVMKEYATKYDLQQVMTNKVSVQDLKQAIIRPMDRPSADVGLQLKFQEFQRQTAKKLAGCVTMPQFQELLSIVDQKAGINEINQALETKVSKQALTTALQKKLTKADLDLYLSKKADIADLQYLVNNLETKVDLSTIQKLTKVIENKCDKSDFSLMLGSLAQKCDKRDIDSILHSIEQLKIRIQKHVTEPDSRDRDSQTNRKKIQMLQQSVSQLMVGTKILPTDINPLLINLKYEVMEQINKAKQINKGICQQLASRLKDYHESKQTEIKEISADVTTWKRKQTKIYEQIDEVRRRAQEIFGKAVDRKQFIEFKSHVVANLQQKLQLPDLQSLITKLQTSVAAKMAQEKQEMLRIVHNIEKSITVSISDLSSEMLNINTVINKKQDRTQHAVLQETAKKIRKEADDFRKLVDRVLNDMQNKLNVNEYETDLLEIKKKLQGLTKEMAGKANIKDVCVLADSKTNIDQVNKALKEIHEQLDTKVNDEQLQKVTQEQATINETLCSETIVGRWLWNSGELKTGSLIPWQSESINTLPENFLWDKDKTSILTIASGMYELSFCIFCRSKPVISIIINGQTILTRGSSMEDKQNQTKRRKSKDTVGIRVSEYVMLPARARISVSIHGQHGAQGFLNIKRY